MPLGAYPANDFCFTYNLDRVVSWDRHTYTDLSSHVQRLNANMSQEMHRSFLGDGGALLLGPV